MDVKEFVKNVRSDFDEKIMAEDERLKVIRTGSISLDISLGVGGIPRGKITEIYGKESTGKSTIAVCVAKEAIKDGGNVLYVDVENQLDLIYTKQLLGEYYSSDRFVVVQPEVGEDAMEITERAVRTNIFDLVIVDSVAALSSRREREKDLEEVTVAETARLLARFFRRNVPYIRRNEVAVLFTNQVRDNIGSYHGGYSTPGGWSLKHYTSIIIFLHSPSPITVDKEQVGIITPFTVKKNKVAPPYRSFDIPVLFGKGIDFERDVVEFAKLLGIIDMRGSHYYYEGERIAQGLENTLAVLRKDGNTLDNMADMCYNAVLDKGTKDEELSEQEKGE